MHELTWGKLVWEYSRMFKGIDCSSSSPANLHSVGFLKVYLFASSMSLFFLKKKNWCPFLSTFYNVRDDCIDSPGSSCISDVKQVMKWTRSWRKNTLFARRFCVTTIIRKYLLKLSYRPDFGSMAEIFRSPYFLAFIILTNRCHVSDPSILRKSGYICQI